MINQYPFWKYLLVVAVIIIGALYALPNIYGEDPAIQVSETRKSTVDQSTLGKIEALIKNKNFEYKSIVLDERGLLVRFNDSETQLSAQDAIRELLGTDYVVALNLAPATPAWLRSINALPMYLGLDLRGGVHFLMQVDMDAAIEKSLERYKGDFRTMLREEKVRYLGIDLEGDIVDTSGSAENYSKGIF